MSGSKKTVSTELVVACGILGLVPSRTALLRIGNVTVEDAEKALAYTATAEGQRVSTELWNVGKTIRERLGSNSIQGVLWTGHMRRHAVHVAAEDLRISLQSGLNGTEVSVKVDSNVMHNSSIEWLRLLLEGLDSDVHARAENWYTKYAPHEQNAFFHACSGPELTGFHSAEAWYAGRVDKETRKRFSQHCASAVEDVHVREAYNVFVKAVTSGATRALNEALGRRDSARVPLELIFRKLLRVDTHSYIICGTERKQGFAVVVPSISQFSREFEVVSIAARERDKGQPEIELVFELRRRKQATQTFSVSLHTELRWSHGKFGGNPEGKIYKDFDYCDLPWVTSWAIERRARLRS